MDANTILELVKGNGVTGILIVAVFFYLKFNDFSHVNKDNQKIIELLEKQEKKREDGHDELYATLNNINITLIKLDQYLHDRLNGNK